MSSLLTELDTIRCVAVFDTVGSVGVPMSVTGQATKPFLGFPDTLLGAHIKRAYHAMAIDEHRPDFVRPLLSHH